jgi:hypothetical protein
MNIYSSLHFLFFYHRKERKNKRKANCITENIKFSLQISEQAAGLLNYSSTLKMEAIRSSEMSGTTQRTTRRHIPEEDTLQVTLCPLCSTII